MKPFHLLFILMLFSASTYAQKEDLKTYVEIANAAYDRNAFDTAAIYLEKWLQADPKDASVYYDLACCYGLLGKKEAAISAFQNAIEFGWTNCNHASKDADLQIIRETAAFQESIELCEQKNKDKTVTNAIEHQAILETVGSYMVVLPDDYAENEDKDYPLCVLLHGSGGTEHSFAKLADKFGRDHVIYLSIRAPHPHKGVAEYRSKLGWTAWYPDDIDKTSDMYSLIPQQYVAWIDKCVEATKKQYRIDEEKIVALGFSQGAYFANLYAVSYAEKIKSYIAAAGKNPDLTAEQLQALKNHKVEVILLHGKNDTRVPLSNSETLANSMKQAGVDVQLVVNETKHNFDDSVYQFVQDWLKDLAKQNGNEK